MKTLKTLLLILLTGFALATHSQENSTTPQRTPEQEAIKQTEKLQQELNLTSEQAKQIYEINLRYARERQVSNTRTEAMERIKNKNNDIQRILSENQYNQLQTKRYQRNTINLPNGTRAPQITTSPVNRPASDNQSNVRATYSTGSDNYSRSSFRAAPSESTQRTIQAAPSTRQSYSTAPRTAPASSTRSTQSQPSGRSSASPSSSRSSGTTNSSSNRR